MEGKTKSQPNDVQKKMRNVNKEDSDQKRHIYGELRDYRKKHGLGCFKAISDATQGKVAIGTISHIYTGTKASIDTWLLVGEALEKLKKSK